MANVTLRSSSEELANPGEVSRERVLQRLNDWRERVHKLYDQIEDQINGTDLRSKREGKHASFEQLPQRVGVAETELPEIDILSILRPDGTSAAVLQPRGLWIIGANGRIDLRIIPAVGSSELYMLIDQSEPLTGPAQWVRMPMSAPFQREPFAVHWLLSKLH